MTDVGVLAKMKAADGRLGQLLKSGKSDEQILDELFLATLSRFPRPADRQFFAENRARARDRAAAFTDALWALINTREFILNH
ncbi:MAG TPA: hypothetical protein VEL76_30625, partial [Gemmataceae bacterium]|nr:hypothetical protein [Gemmataceae bacterium]